MPLPKCKRSDAAQDAPAVNQAPRASRCDAGNRARLAGRRRTHRALLVVLEELLGGAAARELALWVVAGQDVLPQLLAKSARSGGERQHAAVREGVRVWAYMGETQGSRRQSRLGGCAAKRWRLRDRGSCVARAAVHGKGNASRAARSRSPQHCCTGGARAWSCAIHAMGTLRTGMQGASVMQGCSKRLEPRHGL